ncbi:MAG: D-2-hydroxyacid dehydrogenase [Clostridia bacterium]|nr:D-2-hydroxyacid dehydrogenase [Clostridia bacterium]
MKTVVLDGYSANPGDLSWEWLAKYGEYEVYDYSKREEILPRSEGADALIINKTVLDADTLRGLKTVKYVGLLSTGTNAVDLEAAHALGITVANVPAYSTMSVAQHIFALILSLTDGVAEHNAAVKAGKWTASPQFCFYETPLHELAGKTFGVVGMGSIGAAVSKIADAFGMRVIYTSRTKKDCPYEFVSRDELPARSDFIAFCCPLNAETANYVCDDFIAKCKPGCVIINTSRGGVVDEEALARGLDSGRISHALLDVMRREPPFGGSPLLNRADCTITPHTAWGTYEARVRLMEKVEENLRSFLEGSPINAV